MNNKVSDEETKEIFDKLKSKKGNDVNFIYYYIFFKIIYLTQNYIIYKN